MSRTKTGLDWDYFLYDVNRVAAPPRVPLRLRFYAARCTARALLILRRRGWTAADPYLQRLRPAPGADRLAALPPDTAVRLARNELFACQLIHRTLVPNGMCLPRSVALATYLRALGLAAELAIGRTLSSGRPRDSFHAWTELHGTVLNEKQDVTLGFAVLQRIRPSTR
jgi:transglutaminase-like putative cysteine protease